MIAHNAPSSSAPTSSVAMPPSFTTSSSEKGLLDMLGYIEDLTSVYVEELQALELRDMKRFADIQMIKNRLVSHCEAHVHSLQRQSDALKMVSPALKERIVTAEATLTQLAQKSERECRIRAESSKRVQQRLLDAARLIMTRTKTRYDSRGMTNASRIKPDATAINEAI